MKFKTKKWATPISVLDRYTISSPCINSDWHIYFTYFFLCIIYLFYLKNIIYIIVSVS
jgi:hypothetical protein